MTSMTRITCLVFLVALCNFLFLPLISGLQCYGCAEGIPTPNRCRDFKKANETQKKAGFSMTCGPAASGCAFLKFSIDNGQGPVNTESLECFVPDGRLVRISKMNECITTLDGKSKYKVCACDTGDYCMTGGGGEGGSEIWLTLLGLTVIVQLDRFK